MKKLEQLTNSKELLFVGTSRRKKKSRSVSSTSSSISTDYLKELQERLSFHTTQPSTEENCLSIWRHFNEFIISLDRKPPTWEDKLALFLMYLTKEERNSQTLKSYISAVRNILLKDGVELYNSFKLRCLVKACKVKNDVLDVRLPIQRNLMEMIQDKIQVYFGCRGQIYLAHLYRAIISTGYYGMLRVGELTSGAHPMSTQE